MNSHLSNHHQDTVDRILRHPAGGNVEWRQVHSLLDHIGTVTEEHDGKLRVTIGPETEVLHRPRGKDVDVQMIVDLRRMLTQAGFAPGIPATPDERSRDHGDGQWGEPS